MAVRRVGAGSGGERGLLDGLAGGLDHAHLALGALRDVGHRGGDLTHSTARPPQEVAAICSDAADTVPGALGHLANGRAQVGDHAENAVPSTSRSKAGWTSRVRSP